MQNAKVVVRNRHFGQEYKLSAQIKIFAENRKAFCTIGGFLKFERFT